MKEKMKILNLEQKKAVQLCDGPSLIIAGAGSGKTRVLMHKIQYLIDHKKLTPSSILAITFTNKAAQEMLSRLQEGSEMEGKPLISTFHSFCYQLLRKHIHLLGYSPYFKVYDKQDKLNILRQTILSGVDNFSEDYLQQVSRHISVLKNELLSVQQLQKDAGTKAEKNVVRLYQHYQQILKKQTAIDFDDMIFYTVEILRTFPEVLKQYQEQYTYILVDEYQDTNKAQYELIRLLAGKAQNVTVVGDFDQSIYTWRGAKPENISNFETDFKNVKVFKLEQNYRSTKAIIIAANMLISHNKDRKKKQLWTENKEGAPIQYIVCYDEFEEAQFVVSELMKFKEEYDYQDMAVLFRLNVQSRPIEEVLNQSGIPYHVFGGMSFFSRLEIKTIVSYLKLIYNVHDNNAFFSAVQIPKRGIGKESIKALQAQVRQSDCSVFTLWEEGRLSVLPNIQEKIGQFFTLIQKVKAHSDEGMPIAKLIETCLDVFGLNAYFSQDVLGQSIDRIHNIKELAHICSVEGHTLESVLDYITLQSEEYEEEDGQDKINLMTLHHAKGTEFSVVFLIGFENGLVPYFKTKSDLENIEEERRLAYVGMTRAKHHLFFTSSNKRTIFGETAFNDPSQFITEIEKKLFNCLVTERVQFQQAPILQKLNKLFLKYKMIESLVPVLSSQKTCFKFGIGDIVEHKLWGKGKIMDMSGEGENATLDVHFSKGNKKVLAKYMPLLGKK